MLIGNSRTRTRGVIRSSCDRSRDTGQSDFSDSASAQRVDVCVGIIEEMHFHQWRVSIYGYEIVSEIRIDRRTILRVINRLLQKRHANSHHHCAFDLVAPRQRIDDPPAVNDCDDTIHAQPRDRRLPCDFDKVTAERMHRDFRFFVIERSCRFTVACDEAHIGTAKQIWKRYALRGAVSLNKYASGVENEVVSLMFFEW